MARPFIIIFLARSGSTAIFGHLKQHPDIVMRAEAFGGPKLPDGEDQTDDNRIKFLRKFWAPFKGGAPTGEAKWKGFKYQIDWKNTQFSEPMRLVEVMKEYDPKVVILRRDNAVKQSISSMNAKRLMSLTGENGRPSAHVTADNAQVIDVLRAKKLHVDINELDHMLDGIAKSKAQLDEIAGMFPDHKVMKYEDFARNPKDFLRDLCGFIGVDPAKLSGDVYMKITSDDLSQVVENFDEIKQYMSSHKLEAFI